MEQGKLVAAQLSFEMHAIAARPKLVNRMIEARLFPLDLFWLKIKVILCLYTKLPFILMERSSVISQVQTSYVVICFGFGFANEEILLKIYNNKN